MLGLGGASLAITTTASASPVVPLFSGKESKIWTPEHTRLTSSHIVLVRPKETPWKITPLAGAPHPAARMQRFAWPKTRRYDLRHNDEETNPYPVSVEYGEGHDPHHAYYLAAMEMRSRFAEDSRRRLLDVPEFRRPHSTLVTLVDTPIFASALPQDSGSDLLLAEISYTPYVIDANEELDPNGWEVYSENGEYPIEVPTEVDMDRLLHVDTQVFTGKLNPREWRGKIITPSNGLTGTSLTPSRTRLSDVTGAAKQGRSPATSSRFRSKPCTRSHKKRSSTW